MHTNLVCDDAGDPRHTRPGAKKGRLGWFAGRWVKVRPLGKGERARDGHSALWCPDCGRKYECRQLESEGAA